jgi:hypothetical protein
MTFDELNEFRKDLKRLTKKYQSLNDDLNVIKKILAINPDERPPFSFRIEGLGIKTCTVKIRKIA